MRAGKRGSIGRVLRLLTVLKGIAAIDHQPSDTNNPDKGKGNYDQCLATFEMFDFHSCFLSMSIYRSTINSTYKTIQGVSNIIIFRHSLGSEKHCQLTD